MLVRNLPKLVLTSWLPRLATARRAVSCLGPRRGLSGRTGPNPRPFAGISSVRGALTTTDVVQPGFHYDVDEPSNLGDAVARLPGAHTARMVTGCHDAGLIAIGLR